jgi:predicted  nucleic acid-binding Zn-ribbon protein
MDKTYDKITSLKNDIIRLRERRASLRATLDTLLKEREKYIRELESLGISVDDIDNVIKENENKIAEIQSKLSKVKKFVEDHISKL